VSGRFLRLTEAAVHCGLKLCRRMVRGDTKLVDRMILAMGREG
jgi:hypothetical protein